MTHGSVCADRHGDGRAGEAAGKPGPPASSIQCPAVAWVAWWQSGYPADLEQGGPSPGSGARAIGKVGLLREDSSALVRSGVWKAALKEGRGRLPDSPVSFCQPLV